MSKETQTEETDVRVRFPLNWHDLRTYDSWEEFISWLVVHLLVTKDEDQTDMRRYREFEKATNNFTNVDLKITINDIECDTNEFVAAVYHRVTEAAQQAAVDELRATSELRNLKRAMRALEGAVIDRLETVARGFGLTLQKDEND